MTREQCVNLRAGQWVTTKIAPIRIGRIARIIVTADAGRVIEVETKRYSAQGHELFNRLYVDDSEIELLDESKAA